MSLYSVTSIMRYILFSETNVPPPPRFIRVVPYDTSIRVSWSAPDPESNVLVRGYILGYGKGVPDSYRLSLDADQHVYTIESLRKYSALQLGSHGTNCDREVTGLNHDWAN